MLKKKLDKVLLAAAAVALALILCVVSVSCHKGRDPVTSSSALLSSISSSSEASSEASSEESSEEESSEEESSEEESSEEAPPDGDGDQDAAGQTGGKSGGKSGGKTNNQGGAANQGGNEAADGNNNGGGQAAAPPEQVYNGPISVRTPIASGTEVYGEDGTTIDASNSSQGYVMVKQEGYSSRLKCQVHGPDGGTYNYDLNNSGNYEVFPLQMGSGTYTVSVLENVSGSNYLEISYGEFNVSLASGDLPFLYPNQRVWFTAGSRAVKKSYDLCVGANSGGEKINAIYNYIIGNISYDYGKASSAGSTYIPSCDSTLASGSGICYDYANLMCVMLRAQGIPAKLVIGSASGSKHAWVLAYGQLYDPTFAAAGASGSGYSQTQVY